jgi:hypothetical protein
LLSAFEANLRLSIARHPSEPKNERRRKVTTPNSSEKKTTKWRSWQPNIETERLSEETEAFRVLHPKERISEEHGPRPKTATTPEERARAIRADTGRSLLTLNRLLTLQNVVRG